MLDIQVDDVLVAAWSRARELHDAIETTRDKADQTVLVPLLDHTVKSVHHPEIEVLHNDVPVARLEFTVELELELEGALLRVRGGRIDRLLAGQIRAKGSLKLDDFVLVEKKLAPVPIPGTLALGRVA